MKFSFCCCQFLRRRHCKTHKEKTVPVRAACVSACYDHFTGDQSVHRFWFWTGIILLLLSNFSALPYLYCGQGSIVGIATGYGLDGPGIESRWEWDFPHLSRQALGPTQLPVQWVPGLSRGKERPGRDADPSPLLVPRLWKSRAIPLLPLRAVRPVQSLSANTIAQFNFYPICIHLSVLHSSAFPSVPQTRLALLFWSPWTPLVPCVMTDRHYYALLVHISWHFTSKG